jgi:WD40 repeat protein
LQRQFFHFFFFFFFLSQKKKSTVGFFFRFFFFEMSSWLQTTPRREGGLVIGQRQSTTLSPSSSPSESGSDDIGDDEDKTKRQLNISDAPQAGVANKRRARLNKKRQKKKWVARFQPAELIVKEHCESLKKVAHYRSERNADGHAICAAAVDSHVYVSYSSGLICHFDSMSLKPFGAALLSSIGDTGKGKIADSSSSSGWSKSKGSGRGRHSSIVKESGWARGRHSLPPKRMPHAGQRVYVMLALRVMPNVLCSIDELGGLALWRADTHELLASQALTVPEEHASSSRSSRTLVSKLPRTFSASTGPYAAIKAALDVSPPLADECVCRVTLLTCDTQGNVHEWVMQVDAAASAPLSSSSFRSSRLRPFEHTRYIDVSVPILCACVSRVSPSSASLWFGGYRGALVVVDLATGNSVATLRSHRNANVNALLYCARTGTVWSAGDDNHVQVWQHAVPAPKEAAANVVDGADDLLDDSDDSGAFVCLAGHSGPVTTLALCNDDEWVASGSWDRSIIVWRVDTCERLQVIDSAYLSGLVAHDESIRCLTWNAATARLWSCSQDCSISVWQACLAREANTSASQFWHMASMRAGIEHHVGVAQIVQIPAADSGPLSPTASSSSSSSIAPSASPVAQQQQRPPPTPASAPPVSSDVDGISPSLSSDNLFALSLSMGTGDAIKGGWMVKRGGSVKTWRRRYFTLHSDNVLKYYADEEQTKLKGIIDIGGALDIGMTTIDGRKDCLYLTYPKRTYAMKSDSMTLTLQWFALLENQLNK